MPPLELHYTDTGNTGLPEDNSTRTNLAYLLPPMWLVAAMLQAATRLAIPSFISSLASLGDAPEPTMDYEEFKASSTHTLEATSHPTGDASTHNAVRSHVVARAASSCCVAMGVGVAEALLL